MVEIKGVDALTVDAVADLYKIEYETRKNVDIYNGTDDILYVNTTGDFDNGEYFIVPVGGSYNGYIIGSVNGSTLYIKSTTEDGQISVVCKKW